MTISRDAYEQLRQENVKLEERCEAAEAEVQRLKDEIVTLRSDIVWIAKQRDDNERWARDRAAVAIQMADERDRLQTEASASALQMQTENLRLTKQWRDHQDLCAEAQAQWTRERHTSEDEIVRLRVKLDAAEKVVKALKQLRVLPNRIDPPEPCWCGYQADLKYHSFVCQSAQRALAAYDAVKGK